MNKTCINELAFRELNISDREKESILRKVICDTFEKLEPADQKMLTAIMNRFAFKTENYSIKHYGRTGVMETMAKVGIFLSQYPEGEMDRLPALRRRRRTGEQ